MKLARGQFVGNNAGGLALLAGADHDEVQHVVLIEELDAFFDAVLEERLKNHVSGAVGRVARATNGRLAVVARVSAEATLINLAFGCAVERQTHVFEVDDRVDGFLRENLSRVLIDEVVATLDRVKGVPFPAVFLDVGQSRSHSTLGGTGVRSRGVELCDDSGLGLGCSFNGGAHSRPASSNDDHVVLVVVHAIDNLGLDVYGVSFAVLRFCLAHGRSITFVKDCGSRVDYAVQNEGRSDACSGGTMGHGSNVKITSVPRTISATAANAMAPRSVRPHALETT